MSIERDELLVLVEKWKGASNIHKKQGNEYGNDADFVREARENLMANVYDICIMEVMSLIKLSDKPKSNTDF